MACGDDDDNGNGMPTCETTMNDFNQTILSLQNEVEGAFESEGPEAIQCFLERFDLDIDIGGRTLSNRDFPWIDDDVHRFLKKLSEHRGLPYGRNNTERFAWEELWGIYNWNPDTEEFELSDEQAEFIGFNYPCGDGVTENNTSLRITDLELFIGEDEFSINEVGAEVFIDQEEVMSLELIADWPGDQIVPNSLTVNLFIKPVDVSVQFTSTSNTTAVVSLSVTDRDSNLSPLSASFNITHTLNSEDGDVQSINGSLTHGDLEVSVSADVEAIDEALDKLKDGTDTDENIENELNEALDITISVNGNVVGDVLMKVAVVDDEKEAVPYMVFCNDSEEKLEDVFAELIDFIEDLLEDFIDFG